MMNSKNAIGDRNVTSTNLNMLHKIAVSTVNKLAVDKEDILFVPKTVTELEESNQMLNNIVAIKFKNKLLKD